jgi:hypothetical protein
MRTGTQMLEPGRAALRRRGFRVAAAILVATAPTACGDLQRQGTASSYLTVSSFQAAPGAEPEKFGGTLLSDVITTKDGQTGAFNDLAKVEFALAMKDAGSATGPTSVNSITIDRYHVQYLRADGRNTPGVDVPYAFDGAFTVTVSGAGAGAGFTLVRHTSKAEAPLLALRTNGLVLSTLAEVTFYGHDQAGREVSVSARIGIDFSNFADPKSQS